MIYDMKQPLKYDPKELINEALIDESITLEELNKLDIDIHEALNSDIKINKYALKEDSDTIASLATLGIVSISVIIASIIKWIKGKYTLRYKKIVSQSKEVNDMYQKVIDIIKHDKLARFKHRNDRIDCTVKHLAMVDKETNKKYQLYIDQLAYDSSQIEKMIDQAVQLSKENPDITLEKSILVLIDEINKSFEENHGYVKTCIPVATIETVRNVRLEDAIKYFKDIFETQYGNIYAINDIMSNQLTFMQVLQTSYNNVSKRYGDNKENKKIIDSLYKLLLKNSQLSMDYNNNVLTCISALYENAYNELKRIYDILRS